MVQIPVSIERNSDVSIQEQLANGIGELITKGTLRPQMRLPASRALSNQLSVSRNTVKIAYANLISQGYLESRGTSGTYVCSKLPDDIAPPVVSQPTHVIEDRVPLPQRTFKVPFEHRLPSSTDVIDFSLGSTDPTITPDRTLRRLMLKHLPYRSRHLKRADAKGMPTLREAIASSLSPLRGMSISPDNSLIVRDDYRAFDLINKAMLRRGSKVAIEDPCDAGIAYLLNCCGAQIIPIPVDRNGIKVERLPSEGIDLVYVSPTHQQPLGVTMPEPRRQQLLEWANRCGAHIVEWDTYGEFCYEDSPMPSLFSMDHDDRVIYVNSFSTWIGPDLDLGYVVIPRHLSQRFIPVKDFIDRQPSWLDQKVAEDFISSDSFFGHLRRVRHAFKQRRNAALHAIEDHMPTQNISGQQAGRHMVWQLPIEAPSSHEFQQIAATRRVNISTLFDGFCRLGTVDLEYDSNRILFIGYSALSEESTGEGISRLAKLMSRYGSKAIVAGGLPPFNG